MCTRQNSHSYEETPMLIPTINIYIYRIVILIICMSLFESTLLSFCKPQSKLDLPTLGQGSREGKNAPKQIKNMTLARV